MNLAGADLDNHGGGNEGLREGQGDPLFLTPQQLEIFSSLPSGLTRVSVHEWVVLMRCNAAAPVSADRLVKSLMEWFSVPLSAGEISDLITRLAGEGFLARHDEGASFQTTPLGREVLEETRQPLMKAALWMLGRKDDDGETHVGR